MNTKHLLLGLLLTAFTPAFAQAPVQPAQQQTNTQTVLTMQEAVRYALSNNEVVKKSQLDEQAADYRIKEVTGSGLPQINGSGTLTVNPALATQLIPNFLDTTGTSMMEVKFGTKYVASAGISVQQLLFNKSFFVGLQAARTTRDLYRLRSQMSQEEVIYNVSSAYLQLLQTREQFNTIDANFKRLEQLEKIVDLQYRNDITTKVQLNRVTVNKTNLENQRQTLQAAYDQQLNTLKFFMGMPVEEQIAIADETPTLHVAVLANDDAQSVLYNRIDYKLLNTQKQLLNLNVKNVQSRYYPSLSAFGNAGTAAQRNEFNFFDNKQPWFNNVSLGLQLNIPIFDGFQRRNQVKQAKIEVDKVEEDIRQVTNATNMALRNAATQMQTSLSAVAAQERNVALAQEVYFNTNELYKEGLAPLTDLLDTEVSLREAQTNLNNERLKYQLAQLTYLQAKGELTSLTQ